MKSQSSIAIIFILVVLVVIGSFLYLSRPTTGVSNFEECATAGYPVMESYPRQCKTPDGMVFVEVTTPGGDCAKEGEKVNRNPGLGPTDKQCCPWLFEDRVSKSYSICRKPITTTTTISDIKELHLTPGEESELAKYDITVVEEISSTSEQIPLNISHSSEMVWVLRYGLCSVENQYLGKRHDYNIREYAGKTVLIKTFDTGKKDGEGEPIHVSLIEYNDRVICAYKLCTARAPSYLGIERSCP